MVEYLGNPELLDKTHYEWCKMKAPKDKSSKVFRDNEYSFNVITFYDIEPDLLIQFKCSKRRFYFWKGGECYYIKQPPIYLLIKNYREFTANKILHDLYSGSERVYPFGRHFEDGVREVMR